MEKLAGKTVLIPFISGLDCYHYDACDGQPVWCLNPFYFRAGLLQMLTIKRERMAVLIPFISGLDCYWKQRSGKSERKVLIPFISGLDCYIYALRDSPDELS